MTTPRTQAGRQDPPCLVHYRPKQTLETLCGLKNAINYTWPAPAGDDIFTPVAREVTCLACYKEIERRGIVDEPWVPKKGWSYYFNPPRRS